MKITMIVNHGRFYAKETVFGETFENCLDKLEQTTLYYSYGPNVRENMLPLRGGFLMRGWADFIFEEST